MNTYSCFLCGKPVTGKRYAQLSKFCSLVCASGYDEELDEPKVRP